MSGGVWNELVEQLRGVEYQFGLLTPSTPRHRIEFDNGLTSSEVASLEKRYRVRIPPDLRAFLQTALPVSEGFPNWRTKDKDSLHERMDRPRQGVLFDVEVNGFWLTQWGSRPGSMEEALRLVGQMLDAAPRLIPIYLHRMMPDEPNEAGNPVFSVHQTDIIRYGFDLADYLRREFGLPGREPWPEQERSIRFWDEL
jgi:hypothetical protein